MYWIEFSMASASRHTRINVRNAAAWQKRNWGRWYWHVVIVWPNDDAFFISTLYHQKSNKTSCNYINLPGAEKMVVFCFLPLKEMARSPGCFWGNIFMSDSLYCRHCGAKREELVMSKQSPPWLGCNDAENLSLDKVAKKRTIREDCDVFYMTI